MIEEIICQVITFSRGFFFFPFLLQDPLVQWTFSNFASKVTFEGFMEGNFLVATHYYY